MLKQRYVIRNSDRNARLARLRTLSYHMVNVNRLLHCGRTLGMQRQGN